MINNDPMQAGPQSIRDEAESVDGSKLNHRDLQGNRNVGINIENEHFTGLHGNGMNGDITRNGSGASLPNQNALGNNSVADSSHGPGNDRGRRRRRNRQRSRGSSRSSGSRGRGRSWRNSEISPTASGDLNRQSDAAFNSAFGSGGRGTEGMGQRSSRRGRLRGSRDTRGNNGNGNFYHYRRQLGMRGRSSGNGGGMNSKFGQQRGGGAQSTSTFGTNGMSGSNMFREWTRRGRGGNGRRSASDMSGTGPASNAPTNSWSMNGYNNGQFGLRNFNSNGFGVGSGGGIGGGIGGGRRQQQRYRSRSQGSQFGSNGPNMPPFTLK